ncbi:MAG: GTPase, partial [Cyanobacteria bacterium J06635_11]
MGESNHNLSPNSAEADSPPASEKTRSKKTRSEKSQKTPSAFSQRRQALWGAVKKGAVNLWQGTTEQVTQRVPVDVMQLRKAYESAQKTTQHAQKGAQKSAQAFSQNVSQNILGAFSVSDDRIAEILKQVRAELPTTEALLIGKPQAGKSSIVRGLTGVSADIIGQGFRPHTQNTERYAYPSDDLPLLIFTDTVGLGDIGQETTGLVQELTDELQRQSGCARILILTVKINDFAVDQLRLIIQQLRKTHPNVPCLLAVTCLREIYPPEWENHPNYPPDTQSGAEPLVRAFTALKSSLEGCFDRAVLLDFTREEDGFDPVFYGQSALRDALADLLPEAEANAIYQLIDDQAMASTQLGNLYRDVGRRYISAFAVIAATLAAVPLPFATMPVLTALQVSMVGLLGKLYGQTLSPSQAGG